MSLGQSVASATMTSSTPLAAQAADIQQRHDAQRARVINATMALGVTVDPALIEAALMELAAVWREEAAWWEASGRRGAKGTAKEFTQAAARVAGFAIGLKSTRTEAASATPIDDVHPPQCDCGRPTCAALYVGNADVPPDGGLLQATMDLGLGATPRGGIQFPAEDVEVGHNLCSHPAEDMSKRRDGSTWCARCQQVVGHAMTTDDALPLVEQPHHQGDVPVQPAASPVSPSSPFASPISAAEALTGVAVPVGNPFASPAKPTRSVNIARLNYAELGPMIAATYPTGNRTYLSHSFVEDAETCGLKALFGDASRHGHLGPRRPSWALIGGTAFHNVVEGIERIALELGGQDPRHEFPDLAKVWESALDVAISDAATACEGTPYVNNATWHVSNKGLEGYDWWRVKGLDMLNLYLDRHDAAFRASHTLLRLPVIVDGVATGTAPALEFELTGRVGNIPVTHRLDAAWVAHPLPNTVNQYDTATVEIVDFKSGARDPMSSFQLVEYADVLRRHYLPANFALPVVGRHYLARKGIYSDPVKLAADDATAAEIGYRYEMARRKVAAGVFEPSPSNFCSGCGHVDRCPTQRQRDSS